MNTDRAGLRHRSATRLTPLLLTIGIFVTGSMGPGVAQGQALSELPRAEYYVARELLGAGNTAGAIEGFEAAFKRARRIGEKRWIDSIPPLVMLGECYYQQGNIAAALEQYDAALTLALDYPGWTDQMEIGAEPLDNLDPAKAIQWFRRSRPARALAVPEGIQLAIDPTQAQLGPQGGVIAPVSLVTRLDAAEVLHTMGIALLRRWQLLGPLAEHSPLAEPLEALLSQKHRLPTPWVNSSWSVLRGLGNLARKGRGADALNDLRLGLQVGGEFDYFMSPLAALAMAQVDARQGNFAPAISMLQDASLVAATFEQHVLLAAVIDELLSCAAAANRVDLIDPLQAFITWSSKRSLVSCASAMLGTAELSFSAQDLVRADKLAKQAMALLRQRDVTLPRHRARLAFGNALLAYAQDRGGLATAALFDALKPMQGNANTGAVVPTVFQAQLTLDLLAGGALTRQDAEAILAELMADPSPVAWQRQPLETLATITTASLPAHEKRLELAAARNDAAEILFHVDRVQRRRLLEALPLGGRLLDWRFAMSTQLADLSPENRKSVERVSAANPKWTQTLQQLSQAVEQLQQAPLPLDERKLSGDAKRLFTQLVDLSQSHENQLALMSLMRIPLQPVAPPTASLESLQRQLREGDLLLGFAATGQTIYGVAVSNLAVEVWTVNGAESVNTLLTSLLKEIGLQKVQGRPLPSAVTDPKANWRTTALALYKALFPATIRERIGVAQRVIVAPNDRLWYVPFELLPNADDPAALPWIAKRPIAYVPTLGCLEMAYATKPAIAETVGLIGSLFSIDKEANGAQSQRLIDAIPNSHPVWLSQKISIPSELWLRVRAGRLWIASEVDTSVGAWDAAALALGKPLQMALRSWLETPRHAPAQVLLPGMATSMRSGALQNGNDLFLPACAMLLGGTQTALVSRWPAGGNSTSNLMLRYMEELEGEPSSQALRRAVLAQWAEFYLIEGEPSLMPAGKESAVLCSGQHPLLWSGYMALGDTATAP